MDYLLHGMTLALIYAVFAMSLNLELGYAGLYNFGHVAFFRIGAYVSALLSQAGTPVSAAMLCALAAAGIAGALLAVPALRVSGDYFGIATLVFAEMFRLICLNERWLTKGPMGLPGIPRPAWNAPGVRRSLVRETLDENRRWPDHKPQDKYALPHRCIEGFYRIGPTCCKMKPHYLSRFVTKPTRRHARRARGATRDRGVLETVRRGHEGPA